LPAPPVPVPPPLPPLTPPVPPPVEVDSQVPSVVVVEPMQVNPLLQSAVIWQRSPSPCLQPAAPLATEAATIKARQPGKRVRFVMLKIRAVNVADFIGSRVSTRAPASSTATAASAHMLRASGRLA
jgi:hypothetical protein